MSEQRAVPDLRVLDGIAAWCGGLHGSMPLAEALQALAVGLEADCAAIARHHHRSEHDLRSVALYSDNGMMALRRPMADVVMGLHFGHANPATIWFLSELQQDPTWAMDPALAGWLGKSETREIAVISLNRTQQSADYIEFHFSRVLGRAALAEIEALVPTIERSWRGRMPGLVTHATAEDRLVSARRKANANRLDWNEPLLGTSNPAGLSRAEFRVCLLLSRGLSVKGVADELGLTDNTVRSHLRTVYAKTETSNLPELLYRILSVRDGETAEVPLVKRA